jgi:hypothetical protein
MTQAVCCTRCQSVGLDRYVHSGSARLGVLLLFFGVLPGVLYFLWFLVEGHRGCSTCGSRDVVSMEEAAATRLGEPDTSNAVVA